jgi:hypothetical protein
MTDMRSVTPSLLSSEIEALTGAYTFGPGDIGRRFTVTSGSGVTLTVPADPASPLTGDEPAAYTFPVGTRFEVTQLGAGQVTVAAASGAAVHGNPTVKAAGQYSKVVIEKVAANSWIVSGGVAAS